MWANIAKIYKFLKPRLVIDSLKASKESRSASPDFIYLLTGGQTIITPAIDLFLWIFHFS